MSGRLSSGVQARRALGAAALVAVLVCSVPCADALVRMTSPARGGPEAAGISAAGLLRASDPLEALGNVESVLQNPGGDLPVGFAEEIGLPDGARDVRADGTGAVVSCVVDSPAEEVFDAISERMADGGWAEVPLGAAEGATFVKDEGRYAWAMVTCTQVGDATSVVARVMES